MTRIAITFDIDWAPDFVIDETAALLIERNVKSTWFVTHASPAVDRLRARPDLFELGIHPNFMPHSSHGKTPSEVLATCMSLVPDAVSHRTHGLIQSGALFDQLMHETPIRMDLSLFLPMSSACAPFAYRRFGRTLTRVPFMWEEDYVMEADAASDLDLAFAALPALASAAHDAAIFNFHPIHVHLNSRTMAAYAGLKAAVPKLTQATDQETKPFTNVSGSGTRTALLDLAGAIARQGSGLFAREFAQ